MAPDATTQAAAIEIEGLEKRFGAHPALAGLDLRVPAGCFFGLLGPNGAGKTTTVSILTTLARPSGGSARLFGHDVAREAHRVRPALGVVFQDAALDRELTPQEHLELHARLYRIPERGPRIERMLERLGLAAVARRRVRELSGGMRRRVEIARGLLHAPRVLFLDEPTVGLDVAARVALWEELRAIHARGETTLFLTTHSMEEADLLCQRIAILDAGRCVVEGEPAELKRALGGDVVRLRLERPELAPARLESLPGVKRVSLEKSSAAGERPELRVVVEDGPRRLAALLEALRPCGVLEVTLRQPSLEHVFLHYTGHAFEPELAEARQA